MINQHKYIFISFFAGILTCLLLQYVSCNDTVIETAPASEIVKPAEREAAKADSAINTLAKQYKKSRDTLTDLNKKLYAAWAENKRLRSQKLPVQETRTLQNDEHSHQNDTIRGEYTPEPINDPYSAHDYITDLQIASQIADSLCAETVTHYETALSQVDSIAQKEREKAAIFRSAMDKLANNSDLKDQQIKSITRQLKWHKVVLKAILIVAAAIIIKNQL